MTDPRLALSDQIVKLEEATADAAAMLKRLEDAEARQEHDKLCHVCRTKIGRTRDV